MKINSKADLNRSLANAICPEPPLTERRAIHESGVWRWVGWIGAFAAGCGHDLLGGEEVTASPRNVVH